MGQKKQDYVDGFENLFEAYEHFWDVDEQRPPEWQLESINNLFGAIREILNSKRLSDDRIVEIGSLIREFQSKYEPSFRKNYVDAQVKEQLENEYSSELRKQLKICCITKILMKRSEPHLSF
ncbi:MAG TPA: hypothetical protein VLX61_12200 [Anaerolineales bacterium]|nr:hypothetical protein [Anaerolineales bacterium]